MLFPPFGTWITKIIPVDNSDLSKIAHSPNPVSHAEMTVGRRYAVATRLAAVKSVSPKLRGRTKRGRMVVNFSTLRELLGRPQCPAKAGIVTCLSSFFRQGTLRKPLAAGAVLIWASF